MQFQSECPKFMVVSTFKRSFAISEAKLAKVWDQLNRRETFVKGQLFPYRVEFDAPLQEGPFLEGELNIHHGPLLSAHGAIGEVTETRRTLHYFYGSYVLSFRWIRPVHLKFTREPKSISLELQCYVRPWILPFWRLVNTVFWQGFGISL